MVASRPERAGAVSLGGALLGVVEVVVDHPKENRSTR
jgi:hypothetical protein